LKLLCDAGLLERFPEGTWVFYRLARNGRAAEIGRTLVSLIPADSGDTANDSARLATVKAARADAAADYFKANATEWDRIRSLHVPEAKVEEAVLGLVSNRKISDLLDIGTGTGRILELLGPSVDRGVGVDLSREMLALARARLESAGLKNCEVRHADLYSLPFAANSIDAITCHQVLHFATDPAAAVAEAARVLRPGGIIVIVDFAPHEVEALRERHAHRRLGFTDDEVAAWLFAVGLGAGPTQHLAGDPLTVAVWTGIAPDEGSD
jgi:ArsR family transcriptional regulator